MKKWLCAMCGVLSGAAVGHAQTGAVFTNVLRQAEALKPLVAHSGKTHTFAMRAAWQVAGDATGYIHVRWVSNSAEAAEPVFSALLTAGGKVFVMEPGAAFPSEAFDSMNATGEKTFSVDLSAYLAASRTSVNGNVKTQWTWPPFVWNVAETWPYALDAGEFTGRAEVTICGKGLALATLDANLYSAQTLFLVR